MEIIPVIDLKGGVVVRARHGDRAAYRPDRDAAQPDQRPARRGRRACCRCIRSDASMSPISTRSKGAATADAILDRLRERFPTSRSGSTMAAATRPAAERFLARAAAARRSCSARNRSATRELVRALRQASARRSCRSTFAATVSSAPKRCCAIADLWPDRIIVMTLARVGSGAGPDLDALCEVQERAGARQVYLAGGLRERDDLAAVKRAARPASWSRPLCMTAGSPPTDLRSRSVAMPTAAKRITAPASPEPDPASSLTRLPLRTASEPEHLCQPPQEALLLGAAGAFSPGLPPI